MAQSPLPPFRNLYNFVHPTFACLLEETLKAGGPFYMVLMPGEVKDPTRGKCVTCSGLTNSRTTPGLAKYGLFRGTKNPIMYFINRNIIHILKVKYSTSNAVRIFSFHNRKPDKHIIHIMTECTATVCCRCACISNDHHWLCPTNYITNVIKTY